MPQSISSTAADSQATAEISLGIKDALLLTSGALLLGASLARRTRWSALIAGTGGLLLYQVYRGICQRHPEFPYCEAGEQPPAAVEDHVVDEASWESFPASDAPASHQITS